MLTITEFVGRFHPVLVHLPIGFLLIGLLLQWLSSKARYQVSEQVIEMVMLCGMIASVVACITGYLLSLEGDYSEDLVGWHMWMGIGVAAVSILLYAKIHTRQFDVWYKLLSVGLLVSVMITGHLGGSLTHGSDYLTQGWSGSPDAAVTSPKKAIVNIQEANVYADVIQPMLQSRCYSCHGEKKQKGKLRLDAPQWIVKGGKDGAIINVEGQESKLMKRLLLPREDEDHMPPKQKPQLNEKEIALIHWWVDNAADFTKKVKDLKQPVIIKPYLVALQSDHAEKKVIPNIPPEPVEKADEKKLEPLKARGVIIIPVAQNSNYLVANFLSAANISDRDISYLLPVKKQLAWLKLNNTPIGDSAFLVIKECTNLTVLQINNTNITDRALALIKNLNKLQSLSLTGTNITGQGVLQLQLLKGLQSIYLYKTKVSKNDWQFLKKAFPHTIIDTGGYKVPLLVTDTSLVKPPEINR